MVIVPAPDCAVGVPGGRTGGACVGGACVGGGSGTVGTGVGSGVRSGSGSRLGEVSGGLASSVARGGLGAFFLEPPGTLVSYLPIGRALPSASTTAAAALFSSLTQSRPFRTNASSLPGRPVTRIGSSNWAFD